VTQSSARSEPGEQLSTSITSEAGSPWLSKRLAELAGIDPESLVVEYRGRWTTWRELTDIAAALDAILIRLGLGEGSRVGVVLSNRPESVAAVYLLLSSSRCLTVFNPLQPPERLTADLLRAAPPVLFAAAEVWERPGLAEAAARAGTAAFTLDGTTVTRVDLPDVPGTGEPVRTAPGVALELSTSGTTGTPKRIPLTYRQIESAMGSVDSHMAPGQSDRAPFTGGVGVGSTPIVHIGGMWHVLQSLVQARRMVLFERFTVDGWREAIRRHRPRLAGLPPAAIRAVLEADVPKEDLSSLVAITAGAAPVKAELADAFLERYGAAVLVVYGATEFSGAVAGWSLRDHRAWWSRKRGSVGRPFPGVELRVIGEDGREKPVGESGVLEIRTPQAGDGGDWIRTSDLARVDEDGFLYIVGRADDVIIRGGFKILPSTVVAALEAHPSIAEAAVCARPEPRLGEVPVAAFETAAGAPAPAPEELRAWCRERLLPYEVPVEFLHVEALPRSVSQKVDRAGLLSLFEEHALGT